MKKLTLRSFTQIMAVCVAIAALVCATIGMLYRLGELTDRSKRYTEFPPEYDDYADWDVD